MANNAYGLDVDYFQRLCKREFTDDVIRSQTPSDLARAFARASRTADASVMNEPEFTRELSAEVERLRQVLGKIKADTRIDDPLEHYDMVCEALLARQEVKP